FCDALAERSANVPDAFPDAIHMGSWGGIWITVEPTMVDIEELTRLEQAATPGPWTTEAGLKFSGENWLLASLGNGYDDLDHWVTPDHIRCSDMGGGAAEDAALIAAARNALPDLLAELRRLRELETTTLAFVPTEEEGIGPPRDGEFSRWRLAVAACRAA